MEKEATWQAVVLIPKGGNKFHGIRIVEFIWKTVVEIPNQCLGAVITFHNVFHGLRSGRRMGNASLEYKMCQKLMVTREEFL